MALKTGSRSTVQPLDGVAVDPLAATTGFSLLLAFALGLTLPFTPLAGLRTGLGLAATFAVALLLFGFLDELGEDVDDLLLLLLGGIPGVLERQLAAAEFHAELDVGQGSVFVELEGFQLAESADPHPFGSIGILIQKPLQALHRFLPLDELAVGDTAKK